MTSSDWLRAYDVEWTAPSPHAGASMPLGGGGLGLNVWVEDGDLLFYLQQSGARDENAAQLKHGRVRVHCEPNPFADDAGFRQRFSPRESRIDVEGEIGDGTVEIGLWTEVQRPVVHVEIDAPTPIETAVTFESWRYRDIPLGEPADKHGPRGMAMMDRAGQPEPVTLYRDHFDQADDRFRWHHRMRDDHVVTSAIDQQNLEAVREDVHDPLTDLTWGGVLRGENLTADGTTSGKYADTPYRGWRYRSVDPAREHHVEITCHIDQTESLQAWKDDLAEKRHHHRSIAARRAETVDWWEQFWDRSHIVIEPDDPDPTDPAWQVGRNYNLFRYMLACNVGGRDPFAFDGGLFTTDPQYVDNDRAGEGYTPDHRQWGPGLTAQNQRLLYWPLLRSGDFDLLQPAFDFYLDTLTTARARVREYWDHDGACYAEQLSVSGLPGQAMWGFESGPRARPPDHEAGVQVNEPTQYLYQAQLEFAYMMLQYCEYTGAALNQYLPFLDAAVRFYDEHYRMRKQARDGAELDADDNIEIAPSRACESYGGAVNPADATAGLRTVLERLCGADASAIGQERTEEYSEMLERVPPVPTMEREGETVLAPAAEWDDSFPKEIPELYPLFPYDRYGIGRDDLDVARETWRRTTGRKTASGWEQGSIFVSRLGLREAAAEFAIEKLADSERRFPTFVGPNYDWVPDGDQGGTGMIGLQEMLLQTHDGDIFLLPAWPGDWDVDFKLHAPDETVVRGSVRGGELTSWSVTPEDRAEDVRIRSATVTE